MPVMALLAKVLDRAKLLAWALVFIAGVLLVTPIAFKVAHRVSSRHGLVAGVITGLFAAGFVGFTVTAVAMTRASDVRQLPPEERYRTIRHLYAAALCLVAGMFLEGIVWDDARRFAWPIAVVLGLAVSLIAVRLRLWALGQAADWNDRNEKKKPVTLGRPPA